MHSILFVCTANLNRSPLAVALLRQMLAQRGCDLTQWHIASAGTWIDPRATMPRKLLAAAAQLGLELTEMHPCEVSAALLEQFQLVLVMAVGQAEALRFEFSAHADRIHLFSELAGSKVELKDVEADEVNEYLRIAGIITAWLTDGFESLIAMSKSG